MIRFSSRSFVRSFRSLPLSSHIPNNSFHFSVINQNKFILIFIYLATNHGAFMYFDLDGIWHRLFFSPSLGYPCIHDPAKPIFIDNFYHSIYIDNSISDSKHLLTIRNRSIEYRIVSFGSNVSHCQNFHLQCRNRFAKI